MHNWLRFVIYPKNVIYDFDCDLHGSIQDLQMCQAPRFRRPKMVLKPNRAAIFV